MSVSIKVVPLQKSLHMFGDPDRSAAYSLSGHVEITLSPHFLSRRSSRVLLQSLQLTFEGQSEVSGPNVVYSGLRICSITNELIQEVPVLLSDDGEEEPCHWNAIFNINIPGWLPASTSFGIDSLGVSYRLFATAKFIDIESRIRDPSSPSPSWSFSGLCSVICPSGQRTATASEEIQLERFFGMPSEDETPVTVNTYLLTHAPIVASDEPQIPLNVLSKVRVLGTIPEYFDLDQKVVPLTLRVRTKDLCREECERLQLLGFRVDVLQKDKCRSQPSREYEARYPLPTDELQPPKVPLRWSNQSALACSMEYGYITSTKASCSRSFSLLPPSEDGRYTLQNNNYVFAKDAEPADRPTWYTLQSNIPIVRCAKGGDHPWAGLPILRPSTSGPLLTVRHEIKITLPISYDLPNSTQKALQHLVYVMPIRFASTAPRMDRRNLIPLSPPPALTSSSSPPSSRSTTLAGASTDLFDLNNIPTVLPPYSQHYYSNGDRRTDPTPLPLYTPPGVSPCKSNYSQLVEGADEHSLSNLADTYKIQQFSDAA
ncbi:hypothetical protein BDP27DRAFT_1379556 [Rhodocollybia butyracea]|uniref:Uncharacterized protein n=1 Tax=Rhodocollybia butyracea TaxID=206335 RepID=A0A9P5Q9G6_9AGAR|nr:hypothetical protein BDP27DRAFT_1379556 [Rhodocollybia butyracea]